MSFTGILSFLKIHKIVSIAIISLTIFFAGFIWLLRSPDGSEIYTVKQEDLVSTVLVNGTYTTASQTRVTSPTNGIITELLVSDNQIVKKGDNLFHVESTASETQKRTALASFLSAKATLDADTATLFSLQSTMFSKWKTYFDLATNSTYENSDKTPKTDSRILPEFTIAQDNWLAAEVTYKNQQGVIAKDQASLSAAKQAYDETQSVTVTAPLAGTVVNLAAKVNDQVSAPVTPNTGSPILIIADFSNPSLVASVDQVNIPRLKVGQKATIVFDALPDQILKGTIYYIDSAGTKTLGTTTFNVYITVDNLPPEVQLNMTAAITIETAHKDNVLTIPTDAIIQKSGKTFVQLANKQIKEVSLGIKGLTKVEVVTGVTAGDKVFVQF